MAFGGYFDRRREKAKKFLEIRKEHIKKERELESQEKEADFRAKLSRGSAARQALRDERAKVAVERARVKARAPSAFSQIVSQIGKTTAQPKRKFVNVPRRKKKGKKKGRRRTQRVAVQQRERPRDLFGGGGFV